VKDLAPAVSRAEVLAFCRILLSAVDLSIRRYWELGRTWPQMTWYPVTGASDEGTPQLSWQLMFVLVMIKLCLRSGGSSGILGAGKHE